MIVIDPILVILNPNAYSQLSRKFLNITQLLNTFLIINNNITPIKTGTFGRYSGGLKCNIGATAKSEAKIIILPESFVNFLQSNNNFFNSSRFVTKNHKHYKISPRVGYSITN